MRTPTVPFVEFPKIARYSREVVVTEKIDGTNAQVYVNDTMTEVFAGSRSQWITPEKDNFGFARWVQEHQSELLALGPGSHFGEWWGAGIQRRYDLKEKRFSLFNTYRWSDDATRPACCHVVPVLWRGPFDELNAGQLLRALIENGSVASPGFMKPEGVVIFHTAAQWLLKKTIEKDEGKEARP
jgi:hypothetical protein